MSEAKAKNVLRRVIGGWSESYEPGRGSGVGYPDLQFLVGNVLVPVEVKMGRAGAGRIYSDRIRPAQIQWHHSFQEAGGNSFVFVCYWQGQEFRAWSIPRPVRDITSKWKTGWEALTCILVARGSELMTDLSSLVAARRSEKT